MPMNGDDDIRAWLEARIGAGIRLGLSTCSEMLDRLDNPQSDFPSIHVAGTNGKGSLCAQLSALGSRNGELIGLFTSPHLIMVEERARIDGRPISSEEFSLLLEEVREASQIEPAIHPTYFETTFLASMLAFSRHGVDRAVIETGLGGRLDSTRLVEADICAITTISMDHAEVLGGTLPKIASEKAGIHRPGIPILCLHHEDSEVREAIESIAGEDVVWVSTGSRDAQASARQMSLEIGKRLGWEEKETNVTWLGRTYNPLIWSGARLYLSAAHNSESLIHDISRVKDDRYVMVIGMTQKRNLDESIAPLIDSHGRIKTIVTEVHGGRNPSVSADVLSDAIFQDSREPLLQIPEPVDAMDTASKIAVREGCFVFVTGSVYLVGKIIEEKVAREGKDLFQSLEAHPPREETEG